MPEINMLEIKQEVKRKDGSVGSPLCESRHCPCRDGAPIRRKAYLRVSLFFMLEINIAVNKARG
jgi:hypothetical protein